MATTKSPHLDISPRESWRDYRLFLWVATGGFILDQLSKLWVVHFSGMPLGAYPPFGGIEIIPGFFNLVYAVNPGAAWGMGAGFGWAFVLLAILALAAIVRFRKQLELERRPYQWAFGLMSGGIIGNALDRITRGHVVDFLDFDLQFYRWPTFNVADSAIVLGAAWLILFSQFDNRDKPIPPPAECS